jgi:hypothetical protein
MLLMAVFLVIIIALVPGLSDRILTSVSNTWHCITNDCDPTGPAASWEEQMAVAHAEIAKTAPGSVLTGVAFAPAAYTDEARRAAWNPNRAFEVTFTYVFSDGLKYDVTLLDSKPSSTVKVRPATDLPNKADYDAAIALGGLHPELVKVSPRQATERAWTTFLQQEGPLVLPFQRGRLSVDPANLWVVSFLPPDNDSASLYTGTFFLVDAATGDAEMHNVYDELVPATPTPAPAP